VAALTQGLSDEHGDEHGASRRVAFRPVVVGGYLW
jgi:hypothetical protein